MISKLKQIWPEKTTEIKASFVHNLFKSKVFPFYSFHQTGCKFVTNRNLPKSKILHINKQPTFRSLTLKNNIINNIHQYRYIKCQISSPKKM